MPEKQKLDWLRRAAVVLVILIVGYPLSTGPMSMIHKLTGDSEGFHSAMDPYWTPFRKLPPCIRGWMSRHWLRKWRGEDHDDFD